VFTRGPANSKSSGRGAALWADADTGVVGQLVRQYGVPPELRCRVWPELVGARARKAVADCGGPNVYSGLVNRYLESGEHRTQIEKDLARSLVSYNHSGCLTSLLSNWLPDLLPNLTWR
jgi:hypothetical protein